jgi:hypothetical protein
MGSVDGLITLTETEPYRGERHRDRDDLRDDVLEVLDGERMTGAGVAKALGRDKTDGTVRRILRDLEADGVIDRDGGLWGVATTKVAIGVGNPGNPPENGSSKPDQGLPQGLPLRVVTETPEATS